MISTQDYQMQTSRPHSLGSCPNWIVPVVNHEYSNVSTPPLEPLAPLTNSQQMNDKSNSRTREFLHQLTASLGSLTTCQTRTAPRRHIWSRDETMSQRMLDVVFGFSLTDRSLMLSSFRICGACGTKRCFSLWQAANDQHRSNYTFKARRDADNEG